MGHVGGLVFRALPRAFGFVAGRRHGGNLARRQAPRGPTLAKVARRVAAFSKERTTVKTAAELKPQGGVRWYAPRYKTAWKYRRKSGPGFGSIPGALRVVTRGHPRAVTL